MLIMCAGVSSCGDVQSCLAKCLKYRVFQKINRKKGIKRAAYFGEITHIHVFFHNMHFQRPLW